MRLLIIVHQYYPNMGGVEYAVKSIVSRLYLHKKHIEKVYILTGENGLKKFYTEKINDFLEVYRWPVLVKNNAYFFPKKIHELYNFVNYLISNNDIKIVHVHCVHAIFPVILGLYIKRNFRDKVKLILSMHYHASGHTHIRNLLWRPWKFYVKMLVKTADIIHSVSQYESDLIKKDYPSASDKIVIIPNGVDESVYNYHWKGKESNYLLYAGRIEKYKNIDKALIILRFFNKYYKNFKLKIIGKGPYLNNLKKNASNMKILDQLIFEDYMIKTKYYETIARSHFVVNPSEHEAFSIFIAEALAIGVPAITSYNIAKIYPETLEYNNKHVHPVINKTLDVLNLKLLVPSKKMHISTWKEIVYMMVLKLYRL